MADLILDAAEDGLLGLIPIGLSAVLVMILERRSEKKREKEEREREREREGEREKEKRSDGVKRREATRRVRK